MDNMFGGPHSNKSEIGKNIKAIREQHGISQRQLADAVGVSQKTIVSIEKGYVSTNLDLLFKIAKELDVSFLAITIPQEYERVGAEIKANEVTRGKVPTGEFSGLPFEEADLLRHFRKMTLPQRKELLKKAREIRKPRAAEHPELAPIITALTSAPLNEAQLSALKGAVREILALGGSISVAPELKKKKQS